MDPSYPIQLAGVGSALEASPRVLGGWFNEAFRNGSLPGVCRPRVTATAVSAQRLKFWNGL
jgi:hypothetical protein